MSPVTSLILGLGLFFLGLRLVGDNLRLLCSSSFRDVMRSSVHSPLARVGVGLSAGALMQSATAVTFILVSMVGSGLIPATAAGLIIIWCNVGLTALAFVATLNISALVGLVVGAAGIAMGMLRKRLPQTVAGALLGLGLILYGLEQMSAGAAPLKEAAVFRDALEHAVSNPGLAFAAGVAAAAILQSNSGAVMLVITFAASGLLDLEPAMLLIYGTNLGAIGLRLFLSAGLGRPTLRLVRLEDWFCVVSGVMMFALFVIEQWGVPLVGAFVRSLHVSINVQLAVVFLLSNLLPAVVMSPFMGVWRRMLEKIWPDKSAADDPSRPMYILPQALNDPATALDLISKELTRLLSHIPVKPIMDGDGENPDPSFQALSQAIENFAVQLSARSVLNEKQAGLLHGLRAELSLIRHAEEAVRHFCRGLKPGAAGKLDETLVELLKDSVEASSTHDAAKLAQVEERTKWKGEFLNQVSNGHAEALETLDATAAHEDFRIAVWTLHRLAKLLTRLDGAEA